MTPRLVWFALFLVFVAGFYFLFDHLSIVKSPYDTPLPKERPVFVSDTLSKQDIPIALNTAEVKAIANRSYVFEAGVKNVDSHPFTLCAVMNLVLRADTLIAVDNPTLDYDRAIHPLNASEFYTFPVTIDATSAHIGRYYGTIRVIEVGSDIRTCAQYEPRPGYVFDPSKFELGDTIYAQKDFVVTVQ